MIHNTGEALLGVTEPLAAHYRPVRDVRKQGKTVCVAPACASPDRRLWRSLVPSPTPSRERTLPHPRAALKPLPEVFGVDAVST